MGDFEDILKRVREGLGAMADEAQQRYNDLVTYLDTHDTEEIKESLRQKAGQVLETAKEGGHQKCAQTAVQEGKSFFGSQVQEDG